jgi:hypothetical protein
LGIKVKSARSAHIDIDTVHPFSLKHFSINWCIGGADSEMIWYEMPETEKSISYTSANTVYISWDTGTLKEIERHHIGEEATLVRTDIPHSIKMGPEPRWCFSLRLSSLENFEWDQAVHMFKEMNLLL